MLNIVILDACRNNPFRNLLGFRSLGERGLTITPRVRSSLIAYATQPDNVAEDGPGRNGTYTKHLLRYIKQPGLSLPDLSSEVGRAVLQETSNKQEPWVSFSPLPRFCLAGCGPSSAAVATLPANPPSTAPPTPQVKVPSPPAPQASLPSPAPAPQARDSTMRQASINAVHVYSTVIGIGVSAPPPGDAVILINDKDVSAFLHSEQGTAFSKTYIFKVSPELNVTVGQNKIIVKYGDIALPAFEFRYTAQQKEEAQRSFGQQEPPRSSPNWRDQLLRPRVR